MPSMLCILLSSEISTSLIPYQRSFSSRCKLTWRLCNPQWVFIQPLPSRPGEGKRRPKDFKRQRWEITPRKLSSGHNRTDINMNSRDWQYRQDLCKFKANKNPALRWWSRHKIIQWSITGYINYIPGQAPWPKDLANANSLQYFLFWYFLPWWLFGPRFLFNGFFLSDWGGAYTSKQ